METTVFLILQNYKINWNLINNFRPVCFFNRKRCYFVDLFVRVSNKVAVDMYNKLGYTVYRTVLEYYSGEVDEDAYGE